MNEIVFFLSLVILIVVFLYRHKFVDYLDERFYIRIRSEVIVYILSALFVAVIMMGMLMDDTKGNYSKISKNYDNLRPKVDDQPHRYFDIDFKSLFN